jgi:hypothetical protein
MFERWILTHDGDPAAYQIMTRHYTFQHYKDGRRSNQRYRNRMLFCGPGEKMVLLTPTCDALFVWRKFIDKSGQQGINCAVFRNEGDTLSSVLILAAEARAWERWPGARLYTYVNVGKVKSSNPGYCFKMAGWMPCGKTAVKKLLILEKFPELRSDATTD